MTSEHNIQAEAMIELCSDPTVRVFRNNTGTGWTGDVVKRDAAILILKNPRPLKSGLCVGSSDLIGWKSVIVTPDMVGKKVAIFLAPEIKKPTGRTSLDQERFIKNVKDAGGIAGVVKSRSDAKVLISL